MNNYTEARINFTPCNETTTDIAAALLADAGFESFLPDSEGLTAYAPEKLKINAESISKVLAQMPFPVSFDIKLTSIEGQDWNHEWEKNYFKPIIVGKRCVVHSSFHSDVPECDYDIVIDPKMAFGTGHHATTTLIMTRLLESDLKGMNVIDMGTGTGILAILAIMRGALQVTAIEIDEAAYVNAIENVRLNLSGNPSAIKLIHGDASVLEMLEPEQANLLTANINRNVITGDLPRYAEAVAHGGTLLFSGFYIEDIPVVRAAAEECGLDFIDYTELNKWVSIKFVKP